VPRAEQGTLIEHNRCLSCSAVKAGRRRRCSLDGYGDLLIAAKMFLTASSSCTELRDLAPDRADVLLSFGLHALKSSVYEDHRQHLGK